MSENICNRLRDLSAARHDDLSIGEDAAALIEQQAARIAESEAYCEAAEAEVKRLREASDEQYIRNASIRFGEIYLRNADTVTVGDLSEIEGAMRSALKYARTLATQEPRHD